ncbi:MAG: phosphatidylglycerophosphatase A [Rickettsiales bacterium]|nr:MAG: phosphatidylglycerophosphatase A [Rickettsiales bacterium]
MDIRKKIAELFATIFYIGKIKYAPGTLGSLVAFPLCYMIVYLTSNSQFVFQISSLNFEESQIFTLFTVAISTTLLIFIAGTYATKIYIEGAEEQDPSEVVIDELAGQMLTIILSSFSVFLLHGTQIASMYDAQTIDFLLLFLLPFILFRFFDIKKPWPINWMDKNIKGALGVMLDDIAAALFATITHYAIIFIILDFYKMV